MLRALASSLVVVGLLGAVAVVYFYQDLERMLTRVDVRLEGASGGTMNILLLGSDARDGLTKEDKAKFGSVGGNRADTIILAQIVPSEQRGTLLHFPRDLWVDVPGHGKGKINSAHNRGPQVLVDTVQQLTGVPVNHYMEVDILGFRRVVDAIGGIDVCLEDSLFDPQLRFRLPAGHNHLEGEGALSFVRARYATADGDFGRIQRQQQFVRAVVAKVGRPSVIGNPLRVKQLGEAFAQNVAVDPNFNLDDMLRLALNVRRVGVDQLTTVSVPGRVSSASRQSIVAIDEVKASRLFEAMREGRDPARAFAPHVAVEDASGRGQIEEVSAALEGRGFVVVRKEVLRDPQARTVVSYPQRLSDEGRQVADSVPGARRLNAGDEIVLVVGQNFQGLVETVAPGEPPSPSGVCA